MSRVLFAVVCDCKGTGVRRPDRPGVEWPTPCDCEARSHLSQYQLGRRLEESPAAIVRVHELRARAEVSARVLDKLHRQMPRQVRS